MSTSGLSALNIRICNVSHLGASLGYYDETVASAKTANPKTQD